MLVNHLSASSNPCFKVSNRWAILSAVVDIVLLSAKLKRSDSFNVESRPLRNISLKELLIDESNCFLTEAVGV